MKLLSVDAPQLVGGDYGSSEARIKELFQTASSYSSCAIFIDEIDVICGKRSESGGEMERRMVSALVKQLDDLEQCRSEGGDDGARVLLLAATNRPDSIDPSLRQAGRLDLEIEVGVPSADGR